jgi:hypothetical protein
MLTFRADVAAFFNEQRGKSVSLDILTGYIGAGASEMLDALRTRTRLIFGLSDVLPRLSLGQHNELCKLLRHHEVRTLPGLHAKVYLFDKLVAIGSPNFTLNGFERLEEAFVVTDDRQVRTEARKHFEGMWARARSVDPKRVHIMSSGQAAEAPHLGIAHLSSGTASPGNRKPGNPLGKVVRLCAYWPKWIDELEEFDSVEWSTSPKVNPGDVQLFAITKNGDGVARYSGDARIDAIHSLWVARSGARLKKNSAWPLQADFDLLLRLRTPVPKKDLVSVGLLKSGRWPQSPNGIKLWEKCHLVADLLAARNPHQRVAIHEALGLT